MLRNLVGISNDLASLLYCRSSAEIITSRTPSAEIITLSAARQLVRCHDNDTLALSMQQDKVIIYGRLKKKSFFDKKWIMCSVNFAFDYD
jgi:hypothetical protein